MILIMKNYNTYLLVFQNIKRLELDTKKKKNGSEKEPTHVLLWIQKQPWVHAREAREELKEFYMRCDH